MRATIWKYARLPSFQTLWFAKRTSTVIFPGRKLNYYLSTAVAKPCVDARRHSSSCPWNLQQGSLKHAEQLAIAAAKHHGIASLKDLLFQADVGHTEDIGSRLIDEPQHRQNLPLWRIFLDVRRAKHGDVGVKAIWRGMRYRGAPTNLRPGDPDFDYIWAIFMSTAVSDTEFMRSLCQTYIAAELDLSALFTTAVGASLQSSHAEKAIPVCHELQKFHRVSRADLITVFGAACLSNDKHALKHFCEVYDLSPPRRTYAAITRHLWKLKRTDDALLMHSFLLSRGDLPRTFEMLAPAIRYMAWQNMSLDAFLRELENAEVSFGGQARRLHAQERSRVRGYSGESLNITASQTLGVHPRKLSDEFIARAFATSAFSFDFVLSGLRLLGLVEVGPLAVREMALSASDPWALHKRFAKLQDLEVDTGSSAFVRLVKRSCARGHPSLLKLIIESDQHHDVFEDLDLQRRLLTSYYRNQDWPQVNRTLAILGGALAQRLDIRSECANQLLRSAIICQDWSGCLKIMAAMHEQEHLVTRTNIKHMLRGLLPKSHLRNHAQRHTIGSRLDLLIGIWQDLLGSGHHVPLGYWREPLHALGRLGRLEDLEHLSCWIAEYYGAEGLHKRVLSTPLTGTEIDLSSVFDDRFQSALVDWSFLTLDWSQHSKPAPNGTVALEPWLRGVQLAKTLKSRHGVKVKLSLLRQAYTHRLTQIFSMGWVSKTAGNRSLRLRNRTPLRSYLESFDRVWGKPLSVEKTLQLRRTILQGAKDPRKRDHQRLELYKYRSRLLRKRRPLSKQGTSVAFSEGDDVERELDEPVSSPVMYRDLFNPSWEEYRK